MIDLHCHILPGLDDGANDLEESLIMSQIAYKDGIKVIVATPHTMNGMFINERDHILKEVKKLQNILIKEGIEVRIIPGADVHVNYNLLELIQEGKVITINDHGKYILIEFPRQLVPPKMPELVFNLKLQGITPIITHPERNEAIQRDLNSILNLVTQGALTQITSSSLTGQFGPTAYKCAVKMLKHNLAHIIASDAHSCSLRPPILSRSVRKASEIIDQKWAESMVTSIPQAVINGESITDLPEPIPPKKSFFNKFFR